MTRLALSLASLAFIVTAPLHAAPRIVSAGGGTTETIYALGFGDQLVGVDSSSVFPAEAGELPQIGYERALSAEGVLSLRPDIVITSEDAGPDAALTAIENAGVTVHKVPKSDTVEETVERVRKIAEILGDAKAADAVIARIQAEMEDARQFIAASSDSPRVLFIYARAGGVLNVSGRETAADAMISLAGARNAVTEYAGYKPLTAEAAAVANPDVILMTTRGLEEAGGLDNVLRHPGLANTEPARNGRVVTLDDLYLLGFGPRLGNAVKDLAGTLRSAKTDGAKRFSLR